MSFSKLLAVGHSFAGGQDIPCRFRMTTQKLLPRFGKGANHDVAGLECGGLARASGPTDELSLIRNSADGQAATSQLNLGQRLISGVPAEALAPDRETRNPGSVHEGESAVQSDLSRSSRNPFGSAVGGSAAQALAPRRTPGRGQKTVQCELSFDAVRVVRNDLSDSDFTIVFASTPGMGATDGGTAEDGAETGIDPVSGTTPGWRAVSWQGGWLHRIWRVMSRLAGGKRRLMRA